jgi:PAS domain S-box-containing protein
LLAERGAGWEGLLGNLAGTEVRTEGDDLKRRLAAVEAELADEICKSRTLGRIAEAVAASVDIDAVVQVVVDGARDLTGAAFGAFFYNVVDPAGESYTLYTLSGAPAEAFADYPMPRNTAIFAPTFDGVGPVRSDDITQDPRYGHNTPHSGMPTGHLPVRSYLATPVMTRTGEVMGGLFFGHPEPGRFTARAETLLVGLAAQVAVTIESLRAKEAAIHELTHRRQTEDRLKFALDSGRLGSWELDVATKAYEASDICKANYGRRPDEVFGFADLVASVHPDDRPRMTNAIETAIRDGSNYDIEYRVVTPAGESRWVHARGRAALTSDEGGVRRMAGVSLDITDRKLAEERQRLLLNELNHRVKNSLVAVQSIAAQTLRTSLTPELFQEAFEARIMALSQAHDLLTREGWEGASLREVFDVEMMALGGDDRVRFDYVQDIRLSPKAVVAIGMAIHELATNAAKYGALSIPEGLLKVDWRVEDGPRPILRLTWTERDGPPVTPPTRLGFGARLLEKGLAGELSGDVTLTYDSLGLICRMGLPMRALEP